MNTVSATGTKKTVTFSNSVTFNINPELLKLANEDLAKAIIKSVHDNDTSLFSAPIFNPYRVDLNDGKPEMYGELFNEFKNADRNIIDNLGALTDGLSPEKSKEAEDKLREEEYNQAMMNFLNFQSWISQDYSTPDSYYMDETYESENNVIESIVDAINELESEDNLEVDSGIYNDEFEQLLRDEIVIIMSEDDTSSYKDILPNVKVELNFTKGYKWDDSIEDYHFHIDDFSEGMAKFFEMANLDPKVLSDYLNDQRDESLSSLPDSIKEHTNTDEEESIQAKLLNLKVNIDKSKPSLITAKDAIDVFYSVYGFNISMFTTYIEISELLTTDKTKGFTLSGGMIGLEDLINGSGMNSDISGTMFISADDYLESTTVSCGKATKHVYDRMDVYDFHKPSVLSHIL